MTKSTCIIDGCETPSRNHKMCIKHYTRWKRTGHTDSVMDLAPEDRLMLRVVKFNGCWIWTGTKNSRGYGTMSVHGNITYTHRFSYEHHKGAIPDGMYVDHICHTKLCLNPAHLRLASPSDNNSYRKGPQANSSSGYRGVHWHGASNLWEATAMYKGVKYKAGYYKTPEEADKAVRELRARIYKFPEYMEAVSDDSEVLLK